MWLLAERQCGYLAQFRAGRAHNLFLIDGDCADRGRRRSCHLWSSLSLAVLDLAVLVVLVLILVVLIPLPPPFLHVFRDIPGMFNPTPSEATSLAGGTDRGRLTGGGYVKWLVYHSLYPRSIYASYYW